MSKFRIAIIGGGPSGIAILKKLTSSLSYDLNIEVHMFDSKTVVSHGSPYAVDNKHAILNRSVSGMSYYLKDSQDFASWCNENNFFKDQENIFLPRKMFGNYLFEQLSEASLFLKSKDVPFFYYQRLITDCSVFNEERDGIRLTFDNDSFADFDHVICATGNFRIRNPYNFKNKKNFIDNHLQINKLDFMKFDNQNPITIIGSRLSACETAIAISKVNPKVKILMVSNSGELPPVRGNVMDHEPRFLTLENLKNYLEKNGSINVDYVKDLLNKDLSFFNTSYEEILADDFSFSQYYQKALANKSDWYNFIGITNNSVNYAYDNLNSLEEKEKFRLFFNKKWIKRRIAIPIETAHELTRLLKVGKLNIIKGTIKEFGDSFEVICDNGMVIKVSSVINACGFAENIDVNAPVYLQNFVKTGLLSTDAEGRGIVDYKTCCPVSAEGNSLNSIQLTGASTQGTFFFTSAIDVIDEQASLVVNYLIKRIKYSKNKACIYQ